MEVALDPFGPSAWAQAWDEAEAVSDSEAEYISPPIPATPTTTTNTTYMPPAYPIQTPSPHAQHFTHTAPSSSSIYSPTQQSHPEGRTLPPVASYTSLAPSSPTGSPKTSPSRIGNKIRRRRKRDADSNNLTEAPGSPNTYVNRIPSNGAGRVVSLDSSSYKQHKQDIKVDEGRNKRSQSASSIATPQMVMNPLSFENIDLLNTPLSSLRSCSEYHKNAQANLVESGPRSSSERPKSFWKRYFRWSNKVDSKKQEGARRSSVATQDNDDEQLHFVESFRFNPANLLEDEDYDYSPANRRSSYGGGGVPSSSERRTSLSSTFGQLFGSNPSLSSPVPTSENHRSSVDSRYGRRSTSVSSSLPNYRQSRARSTASGSHYPSSRTRRAVRPSSVFDGLEYVFGISLDNRHLPMEIELRDLKAPEVLTFYAPATSTSVLASLSPSQVLQTRRVTTLRSFERVDHNDNAPSSESSLSDAFVVPVESKTFLDKLNNHIREFEVYSIRYLRTVYPRTRSDDFFYESLRIQPFASGAYLRGMLISGFCALFFNFYNIVCWPELGREFDRSILSGVLFTILIFQLLLNIAQLPVRLKLHFLCWESSRAIEVETAINYLRRTLQSDWWLVNKALNNVTDSLSVLILLISEVYLWFSAPDDQLRALAIALSATNLLTILSRVIVATSFSISMHDPQVLNDARRRGLSKWDLEVLPAFVFSCADDVTNEDCSICLGKFDIGEMLISLPCDKKHSFHANCIRQWLQRQNSCPLCQKSV